MHRWGIELVLHMDILSEIQLAGHRELASTASLQSDQLTSLSTACSILSYVPRNTARIPVHKSQDSPHPTILLFGQSWQDGSALDSSCPYRHSAELSIKVLLGWWFRHFCLRWLKWRQLDEVHPSLHWSRYHWRDPVTTVLVIWFHAFTWTWRQETRIT